MPRVRKRLGREMGMAGKFYRLWSFRRTILFYLLLGTASAALTVIVNKWTEPKYLMCVPAPIKLEDKLFIGMFCIRTDKQPGE